MRSNTRNYNLDFAMKPQHILSAQFAVILYGDLTITISSIAKLTHLKVRKLPDLG